VCIDEGYFNEHAGGGDERASSRCRIAGVAESACRSEC
jgi:hypothetical protein